MEFKVVVHKAEEGGYYVTVPSLPGCFSQGETKKEALKNIKEAIELHMETMAEDKEPIFDAPKGGEIEKVAVAVRLLIGFQTLVGKGL